MGCHCTVGRNHPVSEPESPVIASIDVYGLQIAWHGMLHVNIIVDFEFVREGIPPQACLHTHTYAYIDILDCEHDMPSGSR